MLYTFLKLTESMDITLGSFIGFLFCSSIIILGFQMRVVIMINIFPLHLRGCPAFKSLRNYLLELNKRKLIIASKWGDLSKRFSELSSYEIFLINI